ncbi:MAG: hypothetical protein M1530_03745 [Candidatus Marsarchaeota archaeon]|nr:hypothetical protein [Candidatus Marsarchaeota archaeon]
MSDAPSPMPLLQARWDAACRMIFGQEVGPMQDYAPWLLELTLPLVHKKSSLSGKPVAYAIAQYPSGSQWISFDEIDFGRKYPPLELSGVHDISSLLAQLPDRFQYAGNILLGNCGSVERSSNLTDCFYMYESAKLTECKYIAYGTWGRECEDDFGSNGIGSSAVCIKCKETYADKRCLEAWFCQNSSDCHYSFGLINCSDCLFCFHLKGRKHCIGNAQLTPEAYKQAKGRLMAEMAAYLKAHKRLPSLTELISGSALDSAILSAMRKAQQPPARQPADKKAVEEAFSQTTKLLLGKPLEGMDSYAFWLMSRKPRIEKCSSAISGREVYRGDYCCSFDLPKDRLICMDEAPLVAEHARLSQQEAERMTLADAPRLLGKIALCSPEYHEGRNSNIIDCPTALDSSNCYRSVATVFAKYCAFGTWPRSSQYCFGYFSCLSSSSCINAYQSVKLARCFEMDNCRDCSDCLFCHNAENCRDCMFCFNVKAKQYAIGNVEVGKEQYMKIKKLVLAEIVRKLEKDKTLDIDIYNIGASYGHQ